MVDRMDFSSKDACQNILIKDAYTSQLWNKILYECAISLRLSSLLSSLSRKSKELRI